MAESDRVLCNLVMFLTVFFHWCKDNKMVSNPCKCKELVVRKKNHNVLYSPINNIPQCNSFVLLGVTLQSDGKFNEHVRTKLVKANKCLHVLRTLRKEHYSQAEIDHLFISIVLPNFSYASSNTGYLVTQPIRIAYFKHVIALDQSEGWI